jgi:hypothetical protein
VLIFRRNAFLSLVCRLGAEISQGGPGDEGTVNIGSPRSGSKIRATPAPSLSKLNSETPAAQNARKTGGGLTECCRPLD